jgi:hypothetical protein
MIVSPVIVITIAVLGAIVAAFAAVSRPAISLAVLVLLTAMSRLVVDTPVGTMRLEQPAIAAVATVLLANGDLARLRHVPRWVAAVLACLAVYWATLALSSYLFAIDRGQSLRLVVWWAISFVGGGCALLLALRARSSVEPFAFGGAVKGFEGITWAVLFLVIPSLTVGAIQDVRTVSPRVVGLSWEANLYASFLAACAPFGLELARRGRRLGYLAVALTLVAFPLGITRAAWLGLIAGLLCYAAIVWWRERDTVATARLGGLAVGALLVGLVLINVTLPNAADRALRDGTAIATPSPTGGQASSPGAASSPPASASPGTPSPVPSVIPYPDTIGFRLERIPVALEDLAQSPIIGLGAETFGQRHALSNGFPDHIAILAIAAPYETGIVGATALTAAFVLVLVALWRATRDRATLGAAAAFFAAIASFLVSFQGTNALHFAQNWLVVGAAVAVAMSAVSPSPRRGDTQRPSAPRSDPS